MAVAVAQVGHGIAQSGHGAVGPHRIEPDRGQGHRPVGADPQVEHGGPDQIEVSRQGRRVKGQRARIVLPLIARELRAHPDDAVLAAVGTGVLRRADAASAFAASFTAQAVLVQVPALQLKAVGRPDLVADPAARNVRDRGARSSQVHDVGAKRRVLLDAGRLLLQPAIPPAQRFLQEADARLGHREMGVLVGPGPDDALNRRLHAADQAWHGVGVGIVPATDGQHGGVNGADVLAH